MKKPVLWVTILVAAVFGLALYQFPPHDSAGTAAWMQAFGSIAAIGLAVWLQYKASGDRQRQAAQVAEVFARQLLTSFDSLQLASRNKNDHDSAEIRSKWQLLEDTLSIQVPLGELTPDYVEMVLTLRGIAIKAQTDDVKGLKIHGDWRHDDVAFGNIAHDCRAAMKSAGLKAPDKGFSP